MKRILALSVVFILIFSITLEVQPLVEANPATPYPSIGIIYPYSWQHACYSNASIPLKIGVLLAKTSTPGIFSPQVDNISYSLDSKENVTLTKLTEEEGWEWAKIYPNEPVVSFTVSSTLYNLTEGNHTLRAHSSDGTLVTNELTFTVDSTYKSPELILISPKNITYTTNQVPIVFSTNKEYKNAHINLDYNSSSFRIIPIAGNTTLTNLTDGFHKIMVFADCIDKYHEYGVARGQGVGFTININAQNPETGIQLADRNLTLLIAIIIVLASALAILVLLYKRRHSKEEANK